MGARERERGRETEGEKIASRLLAVSVKEPNVGLDLANSEIMI